MIGIYGYRVPDPVYQYRSSVGVGRRFRYGVFIFLQNRHARTVKNAGGIRVEKNRESERRLFGNIWGSVCGVDKNTISEKEVCR